MILSGADVEGVVDFISSRVGAFNAFTATSISRVASNVNTKRRSLAIILVLGGNFQLNQFCPFSLGISNNKIIFPMEDGV